MRVLADIKANAIIQAEREPPTGDSTSVSGKYCFYFPDGINLKVAPDSVIVPYASPQSVVSRSFNEFLRAFPQFRNIVFNPLILGTDMDSIDPTGSFDDGTSVVSSRLQMGRGTAGPFPPGNAPNSVALLGQNVLVTPSKPGALVTVPFDINPMTANLGAANFAVYWRVCEFTTSQDIRGTKGAFNGQNEPSVRSLLEIEQEPVDLEVFLSKDGGITYVPVQRLIPTSFCSPGSEVSLAFKNTSLVKRYILSYAFLF